MRSSSLWTGWVLMKVGKKSAHRGGTGRLVVDTNLVGTLLGCKVAINAMLEEPQRKGHVFNMDGAGANGMVPCDTHRHRRLLVCNAPHHSLTRTTATVDAQLCGVRGDQGGASAAHEVAGQGDGRHQRTPPPALALFFCCFRTFFGLI